jgi:uncharacterized protein (TIGR02996 family)
VNDADALLAAILAEPERDDVRLVFADWLEEHGEPARAELIRVQVALARYDWRHCGGYYCDTYDDGTTTHRDCRGIRLGVRERELLAWACDWLVPAGWVALREGDAPVGRSLRFRRGFAESVACPLADWLAHGPAVVRRQPVARVDETSVTLWTIAPGPLAGYRCWARVDLPPGVWDVLKAEQKGTAAVAAMYPTEAAARAALSAALLAWAKRQAAAPPPAAGAGR